MDDEPSFDLKAVKLERKRVGKDSELLTGDVSF